MPPPGSGVRTVPRFSTHGEVTALGLGTGTTLQGGSCRTPLLSLQGWQQGRPDHFLTLLRYHRGFVLWETVLREPTELS